MDKEEICAMLGTLASVFNNLKLLRVKTSQEELESLVTRAFLESNLDFRKGMTNYEVSDCRDRGRRPSAWLAPNRCTFHCNVLTR